MLYYSDGDILIRSMQQEDSGTIHLENRSQGWHSDVQVYEGYLRRQAEGGLRVLVAECAGAFAGYTTLKPQASAGPFAHKGIPEISDFNVFTRYRRRGIGSRILTVAECLAALCADTVCLGVGLHAGYGAAQRLYLRRGYMPDGSGVWFGDKPLEPYADCVNDDNLVLYLSKTLRPNLQPQEARHVR